MKDKKFYIMALSLGIPSMLQLLAKQFANLADNIMVGGLNVYAIAGVSIINQLHFIFGLSLFGIASTASIFTPQFRANNNEKKITEVFLISLLFMVPVGIIFFVLLKLNPTLILQLFTSDAQTLHYAQIYLDYLAYAFLLFPISLSISFAFRFTGKLKMVMYFAFFNVALSVFLNFGLIHGNMGMPAMGVAGAGMGTLIARITECLVFIGATVVIKSPIKIRILQFFRLDKELIKQYVSKGLGLVFNEFALAVGLQTLIVIYSRRVSSNIAALSIAMTFLNLMHVGFSGMNVMIKLIVGEHLGRSDFTRAKQDAKRLKNLSMVIGLVMGIIIFIVGNLIMFTYNVETTVITDARLLLLVMVGFSWLTYLNASYYFTFAAGGDTKSILWVDSLYIWLLSIPLAFTLGQFNILLPIHYFLVQSLNFLRLYMSRQLDKKGRWLENVTV